MNGTEYAIYAADSVAGLPADQWDALTDGANPFVSHEFLSILEESGSVGGGSGWTPLPLVAQSADGVIRGALHAARLPGFGAALRLWLGHLRRDPTPNRIRRFGQAMVLSREAPSGLAFLYAHFLHTPSSVALYASLLRQVAWGFSAHAKDIWLSPDWEKEDKLARAEFGVNLPANAPVPPEQRYGVEFLWTGTGDSTPALSVPAALRFMGELLPGGWAALRAHNRDLVLDGRERVADALGVPLPCPDAMIGVPRGAAQSTPVCRRV